MEILRYNIFCRYEYWSKEGKVWTDWHRTNESFDNEDDAKKRIQENKEFVKNTDKYTKLKHEYKYELVDETLFTLPSLSRPKGRPKKIEKEYLDKLIKSLKKKDKVLIDENIKLYLYNDEESKNYIKDNFKDFNIVFWYDFMDLEKKIYILKKEIA